MPLPDASALLVIASQLSGYPIPENAPMPHIRYVNEMQMAQDACMPDSFMLCMIVGYFAHPDKEHPYPLIEVRTDVTEETPSAILVHEFTHYLQWVNWRNPDDRDCPRELSREYEAYKVGALYRIKYEHAAAPISITVPAVECVIL